MVAVDKPQKSSITREGFLSFSNYNLQKIMEKEVNAIVPVSLQETIEVKTYITCSLPDMPYEAK